MGQPLYFDYAAATPLDDKVLAAMLPYFSDHFYNPSAAYKSGQDARKALEAARGKVAHWLGSRSSEIIFTAGGTEANNLAIHGIMNQYPKGNIVVSSIEHESVLAPANQYDCRKVKVQPDGRIDLADLQSKIDDNTVLVSIMYANNEVGTIQPLREISKIIASNRAARLQNSELRTPNPLLLHTDACQAGNYLDLHVSRLGVDLMTINGGKIYGPKQSGALFVKGGILLEPLIDGGGQERGLRSGTENVAGLVGLSVALDLSQTMRGEESKRLEALQLLLFQQLEAKLPEAIINGSKKYRLVNNVHITLPGFDNERLLIQLDEAGIMAAAGSACSASNDQPSHVLSTLGLSDEYAQASLRFTLGRTTTGPMITALVQQLATLCA